MSSLRILGPVEAWHDEQRLAVGGPRQVSLLAFLILHANRAVSSDVLVDAVWGSRRSEAHSPLQMAIARLRKALEPLNGELGPRVQTVTGGYLFSVTPGELDADAFQRHLHAGTQALEAGAPAEAADLLHQALALWRGPPLADVAYEDFAQSEIRRLEGLRRRVVECRIEAELALGRHSELVGELEGLLLDAPTSEPLAGYLMLALYRSGRQTDALDVYQRVHVALAELGLEPGPALKRLQLDILAHAPSLTLGPDGRPQPPLRPVAPALRAPLPIRLVAHGPTVFADRRAERNALTQALHALPDSGRQAAFVTGEAGIGKTRLISEFAHEAHEGGTLVLAGRCDDGVGIPYQPFVEALEHLVAHAPSELLDQHAARYGDSIARLVPALWPHRVELQAEPSESERYVLFRAIEGLFAAACEGGPVLLVLEDLHWADLPTLKLVRRLVTSPRNWSLVLLATCRLAELEEHHAVRELLADLHREPRVLRLDLTGLQREDVVDLIRGIAETPEGIADQQLADTLESSTNGNPFFITELVRGLAEAGALVNEAGRLRLTDEIDPTSELPESIGETFASRLRRMPDEVRTCLDVAAVVGPEFDLEVVQQVLDDDSASTAVARAVRRAVLIALPGQPARFRFAHTLMQRYLYRELGLARQTELHRRIALVMEERGEGSQLAELARHWVQALDADVERALHYASLAGDEALAKLAPDPARRWYEASLELLDRQHHPPESQRCELLIKRGQAERQSGDQRFRDTLLEAAELAQRTGDKDRLVRAALGNTRGMQSETGVVDQGRMATLEAALEAIGTKDVQSRACLLAMQAAELMYSGEWERRVRLSDEALELARGLDDPDALSTVLNLRFVTLLAPETLAERRANSTEAVSVAERLPDPLVRFYAYHWRAYASIEAGDMLAARSWAARERDIADRFRQPTTLWLTRADQANLAIIAGKLEAAHELSAAAFEIGRQSEPDALACFAAQQTAIAFERGGLGELVPLLEQAVQDNPGVPGFRATLALALTEASRNDKAMDLLDQALASDFSDIPYDVTWLSVICIYAWVSAELGHGEAAAALYAMVEPWSDQVAFPAFGVWGPVSLYLGSLARVLGDLESARRHLLRAARTATLAGAPFWEGRAAHQLRQLSGTAR